MPEIDMHSSDEMPEQRTAGTAAIEFALLGPLLLLLLVAVVELGFAMFQAMQVYNAVEAGVVYATKNDWDETSVASAVVNASSVSGMAATPAPAIFCGCPQANGIAVMTCTDPLPSCADGNPAGQYGRISAALPHLTILPYPALPLPSTLTARSIIRLK